MVVREPVTGGFTLHALHVFGRSLADLFDKKAGRVFANDLQIAISAVLIADDKVAVNYRREFQESALGKEVRDIVRIDKHDDGGGGETVLSEGQIEPSRPPESASALCAILSTS